MNIKHKLFAATFTLLVGLQVLSPDEAQAAISKSQAVAIAQKKHPGKVVKVKKSGKFYKVRIVKKNGHVVTLSIDQETGKLKKG